MKIIVLHYVSLQLPVSVQTVQECSSPTVWQSIAETTKDVFPRLSVLLTGVIVDVSTQKNAAILSEPFLVELEGIRIRTTKRFVAKFTNQKRTLQPVEIAIYE